VLSGGLVFVYKTPGRELAAGDSQSGGHGGRA
jgi:hypothetical protein